MSSRACTKCGEVKPVATGFYPSAGYADGYTRQCIECKNAYRVARYRTNPGPEREREREWAAAHPERKSSQTRRDRWAALVHYSGPTPYCACCGEEELAFLALDHIDGGGAQQRKKFGGGGFYAWLKRTGFQENLRVLCHNCNQGRRITGDKCPHEIKMAALVGS